MRASAETLRTVRAAKARRRAAFVTVASAFSLALAACGGGGGTPSVGGSPGPIGQTASSSLYSTATGYTYPITVYLPAAYAGSNARFPVIYAPDAQYQFEDIVNIVAQNGINAIVVGVNYIDDNERSIDYLLPGAQSYYAFLTQQLVPTIEAQYRVDPARRTLAGYSDSGAFVVLAMFMENPANRYFSSIISTDGAFWSGTSADLALEQQMYAQTHDVPVTLMMTCSANCPSVSTIVNLLAAQKLQGLLLSFSNFSATTNHGTVLEPSLHDSLLMIFGLTTQWSGASVRAPEASRSQSFP